MCRSARTRGDYHYDYLLLDTLKCIRFATVLDNRILHKGVMPFGLARLHPNYDRLYYAWLISRYPYGVLPCTFHFVLCVSCSKHFSKNFSHTVIKFNPLLDTNFRKNINYIEEKNDIDVVVWLVTYVDHARFMNQHILIFFFSLDHAQASNSFCQFGISETAKAEPDTRRV